MSPRLEFAIRGQLRSQLAAQSRAVENGVERALRATASGIRRNLISAIRRGNFRSSGLERMLRTKLEKRGVESVATVYSRSRLKRPGGPVDLLAVFSTGAIIRGRNGRMLAIPTEFAPAGRSLRGAKATPEQAQARGIKMRFVRTQDGGVLLSMPPRGESAQVLYVLRREVRLRQRYDAAAIVARWRARLPELIARHIERAAAAAGQSEAV